MNPLTWFSKLFGSNRRGSRRRDSNKYTRNIFMCSDAPNTIEWIRFWHSWDATRQYLSATSTNVHVYNFKMVNQQQRNEFSRSHHHQNKKNSSQLFSRIFPRRSRPQKKMKMKMKIVNLPPKTKCFDEPMLDVTKIRVSGYKIKSFGFPISACTSRESVLIKVDVGPNPNGLLTTRINSSAGTIHMELVGVENNLVQKSLTIKGRTSSAQVVDLESPTSDPDGFVLFKIP